MARENINGQSMEKSLEGLEKMYRKINVFQRPDNGLEYPKVWLRFEGKKADASGNIPKFRIEDAADEWWEQIFACSSMFREEEMTAVGLKSQHQESSFNEEGVREFWASLLRDRVSVVCLTDEESPRFAGFNLNEVVYEPKPIMKLDHETPIFLLGKALTELKNSWSVFEQWGVDKYVDAMGLVVLPEFRGQGISTKLLEARIPLCKTVGIKATANTFSSRVARIAAKKAGFKELASITVEDLEKRYGVKLEGQEGESIVYMGMKIE